MNPTASVVIATCARPNRVRECLTHLGALDAAPDEIVLVDASADDRTARLVAEEFPHVRLVGDGPPEAGPTGRRLGYATATGDVIAFLDDNSNVDRRWLDELLAPYADPDVMGVGGRVVTDEEKEASTGIGDIGRLLPNGQLTGNFGADPGRVIEVDHLPSANISFRRTALEGVESVRAATSGAPEGDELDTALRIRHAGRTLVFQPRAIVRHTAEGDDERGQPLEPRHLYSLRRDHLARLVRVFGWRDPRVRNFARTTVREQDQYFRLMASRLGPHKRSGERRTLLARAGAVTHLAGAVVEVAGLLAGFPAGLMARRLDVVAEPRVGTTSPETIRTRTLRLSDIGPEDERRWQALSRTALEPNPFFDPRFLLSAHRAVGDTDDLRLVVAERADRWLAVAPLSMVGGFASTPLRHASTAGKLLGRWASLCVPLIDPHEAAAATTAVLRHLSSGRSGVPGLVELTLLPDAGPVAAVLRECCRLLRIPVQERSRFTRAYAEARSGLVAPDHLSASRRKQLRRKQGSLERRIGAPLEFIDHGNDPAALDALLTLEAAGWKGRRGSAIRMKGREQEWFNDYMKQFMGDGDCRVVELRCGDVTLHMALVLVLGRTAFGMIDAYNESYHELSPGVIGRVLEQQTLLARPDIDAFDPCLHPKYTDPTALYPSTRDMVSLLVGTRGVARVALRMRPVLLSLVGRVRALRTPASA